MEGASLERNLKTGHPVFNNVVSLLLDMTVPIIDETFSEGKAFIKALTKTKADSTVELLSKRHCCQTVNVS